MAPELGKLTYLQTLDLQGESTHAPPHLFGVLPASIPPTITLADLMWLWHACCMGCVCVWRGLLVHLVCLLLFHRVHLCAAIG